MPDATILIPTHDHARTLPLAVESALNQSVPDIEVLIVGDGITAAVRAAAMAVCSRDPRARLLDLPKGPNHGEVHRDTAIREARSDAIFYLCDDDLLLPSHVANLVELLRSADLVQCRNGYFTTEGGLELFPTDLADPVAIAWHLAEPGRNATSLTGTAHTRQAYLDLPEGWTTTPDGQWPDHFMWKKFFRMPGFRGATHPEMTAVQVPTSSGREAWDQQRRLAELTALRERLVSPGGREWLQDQVRAATARQLDREHREATDLAVELFRLGERIGELERRLELAQTNLNAARLQLASVEGALAGSRVEQTTTREVLAGVLSSRSWRLTAPARRLSEVLGGGRHDR